MATTIITTITTMDTITMTDGALYRLMTWLSPSYPVGAFSYSHGLEWFVEAARVTSRSTLIDWISDILAYGGGRNDAILFSHAYCAAQTNDRAALLNVAFLAAAMTASRERHLETTAQGTAFSTVTRATWKSPSLEFLADQMEEVAYPVAVAVAAADHNIPLESALDAYVHAFTANLISAGVRLIPLGHTDGQLCMTALERNVRVTAETALTASLDDLGGAAVFSDIAAMKHETQYTRLFRS